MSVFSNKDATRIRSELSEATLWLALIFSWLTPYVWQTDALIVIAVSCVNYLVISAAREREQEERDKP